MLTVSEKVVKEIRSVLETSETWKKAKGDGKETCVRLGIKDDQYTFSFSTEIDKKNDIVISHYGLVFVFANEFRSKLDNTVMDFVDDGNIAGITFDDKSDVKQ